MVGESYGSQLLRRITSQVGPDAVASALAVMARDVARWESGVERPGLAQQDALAGCYNLPGWAWFHPPETSAVLASTPPAPTASSVVAGGALEAYSPQAESLDLLNAQLERVSKDIDAIRNNQLGGVNYSELSKLERLCTGIIEKRAAVAGQLRATEENRLARTETFRGHVRRVVEALREFPEARVAVIKAMGFEVDGET